MEEGNIVNIYCDYCRRDRSSDNWLIDILGHEEDDQHDITCTMCYRCTKTINDSDYYGVTFRSDFGRYTIEEPEQEIIEPTPDPTPEPTPIVEPIEEPTTTVSYNDLLIEIRGLRSDVQNITNGSIPVSVSNYNDFNNKVECIVSDNSVSQNLLTTPLNDYSLPEMLQVLTLALMFGAGIIYIVRRCIYKWS